MCVRGIYMMPHFYGYEVRMSGISYPNRVDIGSGKVPFRFDHTTEQRDSFRYEAGMWTLVDKAWTKALASELTGKKCLEVFAGRGWLTQALRDHGVDVTATSRFSSHDGSNAGLVADVIDMSAIQAVQNFDFEVLIMGWPPAGEEATRAVIEAIRCGRQFKIVFIGEPYSTNPGRLSGTASDSFFEITELEKELTEYRLARGKQGIDVCHILRVKQNSF